MRLSFVRRPRNAIGYGETVNPHAPHEGGHDSLHLSGTAIIHDVAMPIGCCLFDDRGQGIENQAGTIVTEQDDRRSRRPSLCEFVPAHSRCSASHTPTLMAWNRLLVTQASIPMNGCTWPSSEKKAM